MEVTHFTSIHTLFFLAKVMSVSNIGWGNTLLPCTRKVESQEYFMESANNEHIHPLRVNYINKTYFFFEWSSVIVPSALTSCIFSSLYWILNGMPLWMQAHLGQKEDLYLSHQPTYVSSSVFCSFYTINSDLCQNTLSTNQTLMLSTSFHKKAGDWP